LQCRCPMLCGCPMRKSLNVSHLFSRRRIFVLLGKASTLETCTLLYFFYFLQWLLVCIQTLNQ
ncbi:hypothetical protein BAE44_0019046, partial [Dichanthelium oligosanthes]